jgi:nitronate monooxygenase
MSVHPRSIIELLEIELPIIQAPMLGIVTAEMIIGVAEAGGLGSLPASHLSAEGALNIFSEIRRRTSKPINVNFLYHESPARNSACEDAWVQRLTPYYTELGLAFDAARPGMLVPAFGITH